MKVGNNLKVLLYTENLKLIRKSGLGKAIHHQKEALRLSNVEYTTNPKDNYDIAHINFFGIKSYILAKKAKKQGKKIVYHAHSTKEDLENSFIFSNRIAPYFKIWIEKCYSLGDCIITPTPYSKKLLESYNISNRIEAISNGVDLNKFKKNINHKSKFREKYNIDENDKVVIGIGLYIERKGILDFVQLAKRLPNYKFIWFGYSPLNLSPKKIRNAVNTKLHNLIFAGYVKQEMIIEAMNGADIYICPTFEETEGIPVLEACACKINTIVRDIPVFNTWLKDNENIYKAKDINEFEEKINLLLNGKLPSLVEKGYITAKERNLKLIGKQLLNVYSDVLKF